MNCKPEIIIYTPEPNEVDKAGLFSFLQKRNHGCIDMDELNDIYTRLISNPDDAEYAAGDLEAYAPGEVEIFF